MQTYADTFVKVDAPIEENCRRNISLLSEIGYSCPKLQLQGREWSETYGKCNLQYKKNNFSWMRCKYLSTSSPSLFEKLSTKQDITSTEISYQFLAPKVPVLRRNKVTHSSTSTDPFSAATKTLVLGNLFKHHIRTGSLPLERMTRMGRLSNFLHLYPQVANNVSCECDVKSKNLG